MLLFFGAERRFIQGFGPVTAELLGLVIGAEEPGLPARGGRFVPEGMFEDEALLLLTRRLISLRMSNLIEQFGLPAWWLPPQ